MRIVQNAAQWKKRVNFSKSSVFTRIMLGALLPTALIFSSVFMLIGNSVYQTSVNTATERAMMRAEQASQLLSVKLQYLPNLLNLTCALLLQIDRTAPDAKQQADEVLLKFIDSYPDIYNAWFVFEEGVFDGSGRFTKSYLQFSDGRVEEIFDMTDEILADPALSPWYSVPFTTGEPFLNSLDFYDYMDGAGALLVDSAASPIKADDGTIIGCVGFDVLFDDTALRFIREMESENERKTLIFKEDGLIMYSTNEAEIFTHMTDYAFEHKEWFKQAWEQDAGFVNEGYSPFFDKQSLLCVYPVDVENDSAQLFFYLDLTTDALHREANDTVRMVATASIISMLLATTLLFIIARNIMNPIRIITERANKIADGEAEGIVALYEVTGDEETNNEVHILGAAINKMLLQLNETQKLKRKKEQAEMQARAKGDFLARMSHELRTPMNAIIGISELVMREDISPAVYEHLRGIKTAGSTLLSIINDILDLSKIESGKLEIVPAHYVFNSFINDVINIIRIRNTESPVAFVVNLDSAIPNQLIGDEIRVRQILLNLLSNASKYTPKGFISLTVRCEMQENQRVVLMFEVADSGIGIKQEDLDKLFGEFIQVDMASHKGVQGSGLGLAITRRLCQAMGGDISVHSEYGKGSTFTVRLPQTYINDERLAVVKQPEQKQVLLYEPREVYARSITATIDNLDVACAWARDKEQFDALVAGNTYPYVFVPSFLLAEARETFTRHHVSPNLVLLTEFGEIAVEKNIRSIAMPAYAITVANVLNDTANDAGYNRYEGSFITFAAPEARLLIVDDIATNLKVAEGLLAPYNMQVDTCTSGEDAIEMVKHTAYDIIFMDHMMPEMDGVEATKQIRALEGAYFKGVPIIALTANALSGMREMFLQNDMNDFLAKPIEMSKLNNMLEQWIPAAKKQKQTGPIKKTTPAPFQIEGLDVNAGIAATGGDTAHYITTLSLFYRDSKEKVMQIHQSVQDADIHLYTTYVHALKSTLYSIGARALSEQAKRLETAGHKNDTDFITQRTGPFVSALEVLLVNIETVLSARQGDAGETGEEEPDRDALAVLKQALGEMDITTIDHQVERLRAQRLKRNVKEQVESIYQYILLFEYDEAEKIIDGLLAA